MDQELTGARMPFDMRLHVPPMAQACYAADHYHAMKRLVAEGYITIKPNAKLRLGPRGLWEAEGQSPLAETTSREESPLESYISAETVKPRTLLGSNHSHGDRVCGRSWEGQVHILILMSQMNGILATEHYNAHPAWTRLQENPSRIDWTAKALKLAIMQANKEELEDWDAFNVTRAYFTDSSPEFGHVASVDALVEAFCHFCGHPTSGPFFPGGTLGDKDMEAQRVKALKQVAQTKDPSNAAAIMHYITLVRIARDSRQVGPDIFPAMEDLYDHLAAMIHKRRLGDRMMELTRR
ncbi:hypothetical protein TRIATDRAFT_311696 [Trichoderma atroviride IMI 206040]|uniref:Uncharacterized protein n=1 Tax=Hypocrea atroviridis (strain ATCC 20476 / IMI 206040) TaxID=452589 RepID=G9P463_HYPAI|nr:uncharacterized protein TRIATDRAFT_311696 [Trichoderma atroviride IMI 206040]EHK41118.1 hypothetical protein TRIATDRAFT_311696 [Trichoderma atroviride IMI 206040]